MQNKCAEIKIRAERRAGEILKQSEKAKGGEQYHKEPSTPDGGGRSAPTYSEIGIDYKDASRWQTLADMPEEEVEPGYFELGKSILFRNSFTLGYVFNIISM